MKKNKYQRPGSVGGCIVLLVLVGLVVLAIVRAVWLNSVHEHYNSLTGVYISQTAGYETENQDELKGQLLEDGIFLKMHKWDKEDFIKDIDLHEEMTNTYDRWQRDKDKRGNLMEDMINL